MGVKLCDMMGNVILENPTAINKIKNTNIKSRYSSISLSDFENKIKSTSSSVSSSSTNTSSSSLAFNAK
jgi:hypothetical protein